MLTSLKINNCYIYNNEIEFSMRANMHYKRFSSNVINVNNINVLKTAMIIGPNNSGKTNFIRVLSAIKGIMLNQKQRLNKNLFVDNPICGFEIGFLEEQKEYVFEVKYNSKTQEYIYEKFSIISYDTYKNKKCEDLFIRDTENENYACCDSALSLAMKVSAKNNILIHLLDVSQFPLLLKAKSTITSFASKIDILNMNNIPIKKTIEMLKMPNDTKQKVVNFILNSDLSLDDYRYLTDDELKLKIKINENEEEMKPQENALSVSASFMEMLHLSSVYKGIAVPSIVFDSTGTKKIAAIASYVIDALEKGRILIVDELDNSLHFRLTRAIIALFNNDLNTKAQLICTVHDVSLLDCQKLFRKEQIWFAHKDRENAYLYSLANFTSEKDKIRDTTALIEKYKLGMFGALPEPDLFKSLIEVQENV